MNAEQIEAELLSLKGKPVIVTVPLFGRASMSFAGDLEAIQNEELACGFHISSGLGSWAMVFFPENVKSIQPAVSKEFVRVINLKKDGVNA